MVPWLTRKRLRRLALLGCLLVVIACGGRVGRDLEGDDGAVAAVGGATADGASPPATVSADAPDPVDDPTPIDDSPPEPDDCGRVEAALDPMKDAALTGEGFRGSARYFWTARSDGTGTAPVLSRVDGTRGACDYQFLSFACSGTQADWGAVANLFVDSRVDALGDLVGEAVDASGYRAVTFRGWASAPVSYELAVLDAAGARPDEGGTCSRGCNDYFMTRGTLTTGWQRRTVRFSETRQSGFGSRRSGPQLTRLLGFHWLLPGGRAVEIRLDDIRLLR